MNVAGDGFDDEHGVDIMKCSRSVNQLAGMEVGGDTLLLTRCPHSQLTSPQLLREGASAKKVELIQGDGFGWLDGGVDPIYLDCEGFRVHLDFGCPPIAHHVPFRNRACAIHRHDLASEA